MVERDWQNGLSKIPLEREWQNGLSKIELTVYYLPEIHCKIYDKGKI